MRGRAVFETPAGAGDGCEFWLCRRGGGLVIFRMRCSHWSGCNRSFTLRKHPNAYKRSPRCPYCNCLRVYDCTKSVRRYRRKSRCDCRAYPFPHRLGSLRMCDGHPLVARRRDPKREEISAYEVVLKTKRGRW